MAAPLLSQFPAAHGAHPGRLRDAVDGLTGYDHAVMADSARADPEPRARSARGVVNGSRFDELSLVFVAYASPVQVVAPATRDQVVLVIPLGPMRVTVDDRHFIMTVPFVLSASSETLMLPDPVKGALVGAVELAALTRLLQESFGVTRDFAVDLAQARPIPVTAGPALRRAWSTFAAHPVGETTSLIDSLVVGLSQWTTYRDGGRAFWETPPAYLTQAVTYLRRNQASQISMVELAEAVGIGSRQLQLAFRAHLGCTAQEYLRDIRLDRARTLLRHGRARSDASLTVSEVAAEVGIAHTGRFAQYFTARFGVLPSTLCR